MSNFKEIKIRITKNTAEDLQEISEKSGLGIGEVVDRLTTKYSSTDPDDALYLAIDDILVITSKLSQEDSQKVIGNIAGSLLFLLPQDKMEEIIEFAEIGDFIDRPVRTYSSGMHSKLAFAITAMLETDIMLVDEVLSVGDERFKKKSLNKMKELINDRDRTVIIVSHSIDTLKSLCDRVMWIHDGEMKEIGEPKKVLDNYLKFMNQ